MKFSDFTLTFKVLFFVLIAVAGLAAASSLYNFYTIPLPVNVWVPGKEVIKIKYVRASCPAAGVLVYDKKKAIKEFDLPDWVKNDINKEIAKVIEISAYKGKTQVASIYDSKEGGIDMITKRMPLSLFEFENVFRIGGGPALTMDGISGAGWASYTFFRIGKFHLQGYGEASKNSQARIDLYGEF